MVGAIRELPRFSCTVRTEKTVCFFSLKSLLSAGRTSLLAKRYNVVQMRQFFSSKSCVRLLSLPMRGEWIEIVRTHGFAPAPARLSPCGESGLKCGHGCGQIPGAASLPMRGEWIEMRLRLPTGWRSSSLPMRGEWIEMEGSINAHNTYCGLSPCGESGLKSTAPI